MYLKELNELKENLQLLITLYHIKQGISRPFSNNNGDKLFDGLNKYLIEEIRRIENKDVIDENVRHSGRCFNCGSIIPDNNIFGIRCRECYFSKMPGRPG